MAKRKFKGSLLAVSLLAFGAITATTIGLTSCGGTQQSDDVGGDEQDNAAKLEGVTAFSITNKDELTTEWKAGDGNRIVEFSFTGNDSVNERDALQKGLITISSSDATVVTSSGLYLMALKEGQATITVTVKGETTLTDTVTITVLAPMVAPEPTKATVKELLAMDFDAWSAQKPQPIYEVTAVVGGWYGKDSSGAYGEIDTPSDYGNWYIYDESDPKTQILVYGGTTKEEALTFNQDGTWTYTNQTDFVADDGSTPISRGDTITMKVILAEYNGTIQLKGVITDIEKAVKVDYETITLTAGKVELKVNEYTRLDETHTPENVNVGGVTYEITEGEDVIDIIDDRVYARKEGTAKVVAKGGSKTSNELVFTVSGQLTYDTTIEDLYKELPLGEDVYFMANYLGSYAGDQTYGAYVNYGDYAILLYGTEMPSGVNVGYDVYVSGRLDIYNGLLQIADADVVNAGKNLNVPNATALDLETLDGVDGFDASREATVTGTVSDYAVDNFGTVSFNVTTASNAKVYVEGDNRYTNMIDFYKLNYIKDGDTVSIKGNISFSNKNVGKTIPTTSEGLELVNPRVLSNVDVETLSIADAYKEEKGSLIAVYGRYTGNFNQGKNSNGIFLGDGETGLYVYRGQAPKDAEIGDTLVVIGEVDFYNGLFQIASGASIQLASEEKGTMPTALALTSLEGIDGYDASRLVSVEGTLENAPTAESSFNLKVKVSDDLTVEVRCDNRYISTDSFNAFAALKQGDTVKVEGFLSFYNKEADGVNPDSTGLQIVNPTLVTDAE